MSQYIPAELRPYTEENEQGMHFHLADKCGLPIQISEIQDRNVLTPKHTLLIGIAAPYSVCVNNSNQLLIRGRIDEQPHMVVKDLQEGNTLEDITPWCVHNHSCCISSHPTIPKYIVETCWWCDVVRSYSFNINDNTISDFMGLKPEKLCSGPGHTLLVMDTNGFLSQLCWDDVRQQFTVVHALETNLKYVSRMCCVKCYGILVLTSTSPNRIVAIDLINGTPMWDIGNEVDGEKIVPAGLCSDDSGFVYVADNKHTWLIVLDGASGERIKVLLLQPPGYIWDICWTTCKPHLIILQDDSVSCYDVTKELLLREKIEPSRNYQEQKAEVTEEPMSEEEVKTDDELQVPCESLKHLALGYVHRQSCTLPLPNNEYCSTSLVKAKMRYICRRCDGRSTIVKDIYSAVRLDIPEGVHGLIIGHTHTVFSPFLAAIPESECFISPVPEYCFISDEDHATEPEGFFKINIPHSLRSQEYMKSIRVRSGDIHQNSDFRIIAPQSELSETGESSTCHYYVNETNIVIHTKHFSQFICTSCKRSCQGEVRAVLYGSLSPCNLELLVEMKLYVTSNLYGLWEFMRILTEREGNFGRKPITELEIDMEANCHLNNKLQISIKTVRPEWQSMEDIPQGQIWDPEKSTLSQTQVIKKICGISCHNCRKEPYAFDHFHFRSTCKTLDSFLGFLELHLQTDVGFAPLRGTNFKISRLPPDISSVAKIIDSDAARYLMDQVKQFVCDDGALYELGVQLGVSSSTMACICSNNPNNIMAKGWNLVSTYYTESDETKEEKLDKFHKALLHMGKATAKRFESNNNDT